MRGFGGEIVPVEGGHIVRSTGRKDRHSKVYTAKDPRDRRVRLSAQTAIQFYDVQDRLGYDRPSKAMDWLIRNAKPSIDKLAELPPWLPNSTAAGAGAGAGDSTNGRSAYVIKMGTVAADSVEMEDLEFMPRFMMMDMSSRKDLGLSLHSYQVPEQQQQQRNSIFTSSVSPINWSNGEEFFFSQLPPGQHTPSLYDYEFQQRGTLQSSFSTSLQQPFIFADHFGSEGYPNLCTPGYIHGEERSINFGLQPSS
ncbi:hypothetical protein SAY86_022826 [Trapa natans]|uniref:TCP domain-containing protein n=1 Tax=Trapa natans TaxID=22666 RepID=A0AAN7R9L9_TRANT|nr:hypothetical protein SAY86_022826 [Trapa natans]